MSSLFNYKIYVFFVLAFSAFLFSSVIVQASEEGAPEDPKKWVIASVRDGEMYVDTDRLKSIEEDIENQKRKQIEDQLGFLSKQLGGMPKMPKVETLEGMPQIPEVKGKTFNYPGLPERQE